MVKKPRMGGSKRLDWHVFAYASLNPIDFEEQFTFVVRQICVFMVGKIFVCNKMHSRLHRNQHTPRTAHTHLAEAKHEHEQLLFYLFTISHANTRCKTNCSLQKYVRFGTLWVHFDFIEFSQTKTCLFISFLLVFVLFFSWILEHCIYIALKIKLAAFAISLPTHTLECLKSFWP